MKRFSTLPVILFLAAVSQSSFGVDNFIRVSEGIYRSARLSDNDIEMLHALKFKTIINLENDDLAIFHEQLMAKMWNLDDKSFPMSALKKPKEDSVNQILALLKNPKIRPVLVHCEHGEDRTGLIIGLHRVLNEKWKPEDAYDEMLRYGFHPILFNLKNYFDDKTDYKYFEE